MAIAPIPFAPMQESGNDVLGGASPLSMNVVLDGKGSVRRRPGIADFEPSGEAISGLATDGKIVAMHVDNAGILYVAQEVAGFPAVRSLYRYDTNLDRSLGVTFTVLGNRTLHGTRTPVFAETEAMVVIAGGEELQKVQFAATPLELALLGGTPPNASHVIANSSRVLCNDVDNEGHIRYSSTADGSAVSGHETWSGVGTGFFSADARPDPIVALWENTDEVFAFGKSNLQIFVPDPTTFYTPIATREVGLSAADSVIKIEQRFAWLDHRRRFVVSDGREFQFLETDAIKATVDAMAVVSDCFGYRVTLGPVDALVWTFPSARVTLCYQIGGGWSQWGSWDTGTNNWKQFLPTCHAYNGVTQEHYVGGENGVIGVLSFDTQTDRPSPDADPVTAAQNAATTVPAFVETGALNRGTNKRKWARSITLGIRRGHATAGENPLGHLQYRDDDGPWSSKIPIRLGKPGDTNPVIRPVTGMGVYRYRQWRLWFDGTEPFILVKAEEEYDVLEV